jgi:hypothetical protein
MGVMEQGTFGITIVILFHLSLSLSLYKNQRTKSEKTDSDLGLCSLKPSRVLNPACIQQKKKTRVIVLLLVY